MGTPDPLKIKKLKLEVDHQNGGRFKADLRNVLIHGFATTVVKQNK